jgi:hypothetical protein
MSLELVMIVILTIFALGAGVALFFVRRRMSRLERQYRQFVTGTSGGNLEQVLNAHLARVQEATTRVDELRGTTEFLNIRLRTAIQHTGLVRFNPFGDMGGDLSFALALADAEGNGLVLCSLHGRGEARFFAKPLQQWTSPYALSDEENQAVRRARESHGAGQGFVDKDS